MNINELASRDVADLRVLAAQYGIKTHPKHKAETIAKLIVEHVQNTTKNTDTMKHPAEQAAKPPMHICTEEEVNTAIAKLLEKPGFTASYPGDDTVIFRCRGAEESLHLSTVLRVIKSKAESVSRGAIAPRGIIDSKINPTANSGIVLMV